MLIITFQALSCSLHFPINIRPGACLETAVVTPCVGGIFLLFLFFWELELTHLAISIPSAVLAVLSLNSRVTCHQKFPGMGFMTFMLSGQNTEAIFLSPPRQNYCGETVGTLSLSLLAAKEELRPQPLGSGGWSTLTELGDPSAGRLSVRSQSRGRLSWLPCSLLGQIQKAGFLEISGHWSYNL